MLIRWKAEVLQLVASSPDTPEDVVIITGPLSSLVSVGLALAGGLSIADSFGVNLEPVSTPPTPPSSLHPGALWGVCACLLLHLMCVKHAAASPKRALHIHA